MKNTSEQTVAYVILAALILALITAGFAVWHRQKSRQAENARQEQRIEEQRKEFEAKRAREREAMQEREKRIADLDSQEKARLDAIKARQAENVNANIDQLENAYRHSVIRSEKEQEKAETWGRLKDSFDRHAEFCDDMYWDDDVHGQEALQYLEEKHDNQREAQECSEYWLEHQANYIHESVKTDRNQEALEKARKTAQSQ